jgi:hypothetical protein
MFEHPEVTVPRHPDLVLKLLLGRLPVQVLGLGGLRIRRPFPTMELVDQEDDEVDEYRSTFSIDQVW